MISELKQYWKVNIVNDNPTFPFLVIDNWYTPNEEKAIWKELDFYNSLPNHIKNRAENTIVARDNKGNAESNAYRFYIENYYKDKKISHIINCNYKQRTSQFHSYIKQCLPYSRSFISSNSDLTFLSYYEENDHYKPHHDTFLWTCLIWMVKEPKLFNGGDFTLEEPGVEIKLKNNRMVMFPSCFTHSVSPIKFHTQPKEMGYGRYAITHFYYSNPEVK